MYRLLSERYGWTPQQIGELTTAQIMMYIGDGDRKPVTRKFKTYEEAKAFSEQQQRR